MLEQTQAPPLRRPGAGRPPEHGRARKRQGTVGDVVHAALEQRGRERGGSGPRGLAGEHAGRQELAAGGAAERSC